MKTIERLRELGKKATAGPWRGEVEDPYTLGSVTSEEHGLVANIMVCFNEQEDEAAATTELIAELRNALPALLAVVEAQAAEIAAWREFQEEAESRSWSKAWPVHADWIADAQNATDAAGALKGVE